MSTPANLAAFKRWLTGQIDALDDPHPDEQQFYDAVATIREARRIAIALNRPDIAEVCRNIRTQALALNVAQEVLATCLSMLTADTSAKTLFQNLI